MPYIKKHCHQRLPNGGWYKLTTRHWVDSWQTKLWNWCCYALVVIALGLMFYAAVWMSSQIDQRY